MSCFCKTETEEIYEEDENLAEEFVDGKYNEDTYVKETESDSIDVDE